MSCKHENIKSVNCVLYCMDCGATLPADFFTKKAEKPPADVKPDNSPVENQTGAESAGNDVSGDGVPVLCEGVQTIAFDDCPNEATPDGEPAEMKQEAPAESPDKTEQKKERATRQPKKEKGGTK